MNIKVQIYAIKMLSTKKLLLVKFNSPGGVAIDVNKCTWDLKAWSSSVDTASEFRSQILP